MAETNVEQLIVTVKFRPSVHHHQVKTVHHFYSIYTSTVLCGFSVFITN